MTFVVLDPKRRFVRATLSLIVASAIAVALVTRARPVAAQQPTFQTTVNFVDVDVTVADAQGHFVSGLTADDFEVFEDGKPQTIQTFSVHRTAPSNVPTGTVLPDSRCPTTCARTVMSRQGASISSCWTT